MKKVLLLLASGFEAYEASVFSDVLAWNNIDGDGGTEMITCGVRSPLHSTLNAPLMPSRLASEIHSAEFDALAIPGGLEELGFYEDAYHEDFLSLIRRFDQEGKTIATVCVGALPLGKSGVLAGRSGTTYHLGNGRRQAQLAAFGVNVLKQPVVVDRNIITSSCPATAMDVAFCLLEQRTTPLNASNLKYLMGFPETPLTQSFPPRQSMIR